MRVTLLLSFILLYFYTSLFAENNTLAGNIEIVHSKIAIICDAEIEDPTYYNNVRRQIYESMNLRVIRGIYRYTGFKLDNNTFTTFVFPFTFLAIACILIVCGYLIRKIKFRCYLLASLFLFCFVFILYILSGIASLNQFDFKDNRAAQFYYDSFIYNGIDFDVYTNWEEFTEYWNASIDDNILPYSAIAWAGMPYELGNNKVNYWLDSVSTLPILHISIGPHLPGKFHHSIFPEARPKLDWNINSGKSVCDKKTAYFRNAEWQNGINNATMGVYPWKKNSVFYAKSTISTDKFNQAITNYLNQSPVSCWIRPKLENLVALRMDDPGASQNAYLEAWRYPELTLKQWKSISNVLEKADAKMSIGYVSGWLDDGNHTLGELTINNSKVLDRIKGKVYPSMEVKYFNKSSNMLYDCKTQFEYLNSNNRFELELHGHTHITPMTKEWLNAKDRYSNYNWYREFLNTQTFPFSQQTYKLQRSIVKESLTLFEEHKIPKPWALIPPGHKISYDTLKVINKFNILFMSDYSVSIMKNNKPYRCNLIKTHDGAQKKYSIALKDSQAMTMMIHDKDIAQSEPSWFSDLINDLKSNNRKIITLKELFFKLTICPKVKYYKIKNTLALNFNTNQRIVEYFKNKKHHFDFKFKLPTNTSIASLPNNIQLIDDSTLRISLNGDFSKKEIQLKYLK